MTKPRVATLATKRVQRATPTPIAILTKPADADDAQTLAKTLQQGLALIDAVTADPGRHSTAELARRSGLPRAVVPDLVAILVEQGCLRRSPQGSLLPGLQLLAAQASLFDGLPIRRLLKPRLQGLAQHIRGTVSVMTMDGARPVLIEEAYHRAMPTAPSAATQHGTVVDSAVGHALLAGIDRHRREALLLQLANLDAHSNAGRWPELKAKVLRSLDHCVLRGWCGSETDGPGASPALCVPLLSLPGGMPLALRCAVPAFRLGKGQLEAQLAPLALGLAHDFRAAVAAARPAMRTAIAV